MPRKTIIHYGVKGMKWGVLTPDEGGSSSGASKKPTTPAKSTFQSAPGAAEAMRAEAEFLRSIGQHDLALKLEQDFAAALAPASTSGGASLSSGPEEEEEEKKTGGKASAGKGKGGKAAKEEEKEGEEGDEEKDKEGEEEKKSGKAGAAPKAAAKKEEKKKEKDKDKKLTPEEQAKLVDSQNKAAEAFRQEAVQARQRIATLTAEIQAAQLKMASIEKTAERDRLLGSKHAASYKSALTAFSEQIAAAESEINIKSQIATNFEQKAAEWTSMAIETQAKYAAQHGDYVMYDPNDKTIIHYGVKGMRWGVRRTPAQLGRAIKNKRTEAKANRTAKRNERKAAEREQLLHRAKEYDAASEYMSNAVKTGNSRGVFDAINLNKPLLKQLADDIDGESTTVANSETNPDRGYMLKEQSKSIRAIANNPLKETRGIIRAQEAGEFLGQMFKDGANYNRVEAESDWYKPKKVQHGDIMNDTDSYILDTEEPLVIHYGVKGMRWGVRRTAAQLGRSVKSKAESAGAAAKKNAEANRAKDSAQLRKLGLNRLANFNDKKPLEGYEVAAVRKGAKLAKKGLDADVARAKTAGRAMREKATTAKNWVKDHPEESIIIAGFATSAALKLGTMQMQRSYEKQAMSTIDRIALPKAKTVRGPSGPASFTFSDSQKSFLKTQGMSIDKTGRIVKDIL